MRRIILLTLSVIVAGSVIADETQKRGETAERPAGRAEPIEISGVVERMKQQFTRMDHNGDGELTFEELTRVRDANRRGGIARGNERPAGQGQEARRAQMRERMEKRAQDMLTKYDADESSGLNVEEFTKTRVEPLQNMDANKDGKVTRDEARVSRQAQGSS